MQCAHREHPECLHFQGGHLIQVFLLAIPKEKEALTEGALACLLLTRVGTAPAFGGLAGWGWQIFWELRCAFRFARWPAMIP